MTTSRPLPSERLGPRDWSVLAAVLAGGAILRVREAGRAPMWFDEIYTTWAARGGIDRVLDTVASDVHPPLHTLLVSAWVALGGESTAWLRSLSILFGLATLVVVFQLGRAMFGRGAGFFAAALLAAHPVHVYFSQESRVYALLWLELATAWWLAWRWLSAGRARDAAGYVAVSALALYTHYLAGMVLAFTAAGGLLWLRDPGAKRRALAWAGLHVAIALLFLPQVPTFLVQQDRLAHDHWTAAADARDLRDWLRHMAAGSTLLVPVCAALGVAAFLRPPGRRAAFFLAGAALAPVLLAWWMGVRGAHVFTARYMFFALPGAVVLAGGGLAVLTGLVRDRAAPLRAAPALLLAALIVIEARAAVTWEPNTEATELAAAMVPFRREVRAGDVVFCADTHALLSLGHYDHGRARYRLLWLEERLPYYEGALLIADSLRAGRAAFPPPAGTRWWAVRVRHGGRNAPEASALFDAAAGGRVRHFDSVSLWGPVGDSPAGVEAARP